MHFTWYDVAYSKLRARGIHDEVVLIKEFVGYENAKTFHASGYPISNPAEFWKAFFVAILGHLAYHKLPKTSINHLLSKLCACCDNSVSTTMNSVNNLQICEKCEEPGKYYHCITQTAALDNYLLEKEDLAKLSRGYGINRYYTCTLFLEGEVLEAAYEKHGGPKGLENALAARKSVRQARLQLQASNKRKREVQHEGGRERRAKTVAKAFVGSDLVYDGDNLLLKTFIQEGPKAAGVAKVDELLRKFRLQTARIEMSEAYIKGEITFDEAKKKYETKLLREQIFREFGHEYGLLEHLAHSAAEEAEALRSIALVFVTCRHPACAHRRTRGGQMCDAHKEQRSHVKLSNEGRKCVGCSSNTPSSACPFNKCGACCRACARHLR
jgi:hypothetical protein